MPIAISLPRLRSRIEALSRFGRNPDGRGITRSCWSPAHEEARAWLLARMKEAGLATMVDPAGNTFGRLGGGGPTVMTGSHIDTVPQGGPLDGALGVLAGLECLHAIKEAGITTRRPLAVAAWSDEEGRYGSLFGSRAFTGKLDPKARPRPARGRWRAAGRRHGARGLRRQEGAQGRVRPRDALRVRRASHRAGAEPGGRAHPHRRGRGNRRNPQESPHRRRRAGSRGHDAHGPAEGRLPGRGRVRAPRSRARREEGERPQRDQLRSHRDRARRVEHRARARRAPAGDTGTGPENPRAAGPRVPGAGPRRGSSPRARA